MGRVALVAYGDGGSVWVGIDRVGGEPLGAVELRSGSIEGQMTGTATVYPTWALAWGAVAPGIVRAGVRNEEGETFPARIVPIPAELERSIGPSGASPGDGAPKLAVLLAGGLEDTRAGGGWSWVLSDLKSLLETGSPMDPGDALNQG